MAIDFVSHIKIDISSDESGMSITCKNVTP